MSLELRVVTADGDEMSTPYLVRFGGWTEDRYFVEAPESRIVEFEDGEVIVHSPAGRLHQRLIRFLTMLSQGYVDRRRLGEVFNGPAVVRLRSGLDYEPDLFFIPVGLLNSFGEEFFAGAPGFIIEVTSKGTRLHDLRTKAAAYREHGVQEYWVVDPEHRLVIRHMLPADPQSPYQVREYGAGRLESLAIPGFWLDVAWLWQDPLPDAFTCLEQILSA
jgi:Uma2 family endonuclease